MILTYDHYVLAHENENCPSWVKNERYSYCENFNKIFTFFFRK